MYNKLKANYSVIFTPMLTQLQELKNKKYGGNKQYIEINKEIAQLKEQPLGSRLLLPSAMFRSGEETFLDDLTRTDVQNALQVPVDIVKSSGQDFIDAVIGEKQTDPDCKTERLI